MDERATIRVNGTTYSEMDFCLAYHRQTLDDDIVTFCLGDYIIDMPAEVAFGAIVDAANSRVQRMPKCLGPREEA